MSQVKMEDEKGLGDTEEKAEPVISEEKEVEHSIDESDLPLDQLPRGIAEMATSKPGVIRFECLPCKMFRMTPENVLTHCQSESHLKRLKDWDEKPVAKARSEIVKSATSKKSKKKVKKDISVEPTKEVDCWRLINPMNGSIWCLACHCTISTDQAWSNHAQKHKHLNKVALSDPESVPRLEWKVSCQGLAYVFCAQCLVNVRKVSDIEAHLESAQHQKSLWSRPITDVLRTLKCWKLKKPDRKTQWCIACEMDVAYWGWTMHCESMDHIIKMLSMDSRLTRGVKWSQHGDGDGFTCELCSVSDKLEDLRWHLNSKKHVKSFDEWFQSDENDEDGLGCGICSKYVRKEFSFAEHIHSYSHLNALKAIFPVDEDTGFWCEICKTELMIQSKWEEHISSKSHLKKQRRQKKKQSEKFEHYCYYCKIDCHNKMSLDDHIAGKKHRQKMNEYFRELEKNHVADEQSVEEKFEDGGEGAIPRANGMDLPVMEQPMNIEVGSPNDELFAPIAFDPKAGMDGSQYLSRSPKMGKCRGQIRFRLECPVCSDSWCLACDRPISMDEQYWDIHTEFSDHKPNLEAAIKCCSPEGLRWEHGPNGEHSVECLLCVTQIPRLSDIVSHISDQTHRMNVCRANEFCREGLEGTDKSLCLLCDEQSADLDWQDHCNGAEHRSNLRERWQSFWADKGTDLADLNHGDETDLWCADSERQMLHKGEWDLHLREEPHLKNEQSNVECKEMDLPLEQVVCANPKKSKKKPKLHSERWRLDLCGGRSWCLACNCEASREMWKEHKKSSTHRSQLKLFAEVANPDGLIWKSDHTGKDWVDCVVCSAQINEVSAVQDHIKTPDHWESVRRANEDCKQESLNNGHWRCSMCNKEVTRAEDWINHCEGKEHRKNLRKHALSVGLRAEPMSAHLKKEQLNVECKELDLPFEPVVYAKLKKSKRKSKVHSGCWRLDLSNKDSWCLVCNCKASIEMWKEHTRSVFHRSQVLSLMDSANPDGLRWKSDHTGKDWVNCVVCSVRIDEVGKVQDHIKTPDHWKSVRRANEDCKQASSERGRFKCLVCYKVIKCENGWISHCSGMTHRRSLVTNLHRLGLRVEPTSIPERDLNLNLSGETHLKDEQSDVERAEIDLPLESVMCVKPKQLRQKHHFRRWKLDLSEERSWCLACNCEASREMWKKHRLSIMHRSQLVLFAGVANPDGLRWEWDHTGKGWVYCVVCSAHIDGVKAAQDHIKMTDHCKSVRRANETCKQDSSKKGCFDCLLCNQVIKCAEGWTSHCKGRKHRRNLVEYSHRLGLRVEPLSLPQKDLNLKGKTHLKDEQSDVECKEMNLPFEPVMFAKPKTSEMNEPGSVRWRLDLSEERSVWMDEVSAVQDHIKTPDYWELVRRANEACKQDSSKKGTLICLLCNTRMKCVDGWNGHCKGNNHQWNWMKYALRLGLIVEPMSIHLKSEQLNVECKEMDVPLEQVVCAEPDKSQKKPKLHSERCRLDLSEEHSWCLACDCEASREMWKEHKKSITHRSQLKLFAEVANPDGLIWKSDHTGKDWVDCVVCSAQINEVSAVQDHIKTPDHWESVRRANEACKQDSSKKRRFECLVCNKVIRSAKCWIGHCNGNKHRRNLVTDLHRLGLNLDPMSIPDKAEQQCDSGSESDLRSKQEKNPAESGQFQCEEKVSVGDSQATIPEVAAVVLIKGRLRRGMYAIKRDSGANRAKVCVSKQDHRSGITVLCFGSLKEAKRGLSCIEGELDGLSLRLLKLNKNLVRFVDLLKYQHCSFLFDSE